MNIFTKSSQSSELIRVYLTIDLSTIRSSFESFNIHGHQWFLLEFMKRIVCDKCRPDCRVDWRIDPTSKDESHTGNQCSAPALSQLTQIRLAMEIEQMQISKLLDVLSVQN